MPAQGEKTTQKVDKKHDLCYNKKYIYIYGGKDMIKIIHYSVSLDDDTNITSIELKFKHIQKENDYEEYPLLTAISVALCKSTLLEDVGKAFKLAINPRRKDIANMTINLKQSQLSNVDIGNFVAYFQEVLNQTS